MRRPQPDTRRPFVSSQQRVMKIPIAINPIATNAKDGGSGTSKTAFKDPSNTSLGGVVADTGATPGIKGPFATAFFIARALKPSPSDPNIARRNRGRVNLGKRVWVSGIYAGV